MRHAPQPFRFEQLPRLSGPDVELAGAIQRKLPPWDRLAATLERALETPVTTGIATTTALRAGEHGAGLTAGWIGGLVDANGQTAGVAHIDAPLVQAIAARLLGRQPARVEVRPVLPAEEEAMALLLGVLLSEAGVPLVGQTAGAAALDALAERPVGRSMGHLSVDNNAGWVTLWADPSCWPERSPAFRAADQRRRLKRSPLRGGWALESQVRLTSFRAPPSELRELAVGDVLLPAAWRGQSAPARGTLCLAGRPVATVALDWSRRIECRVVDPSRGDEAAVSNTDDLTRKTLEQMRPVLHDRLEQLEIVIGTTSLTLGELLEVQPGRTFALDVPVDAPVDLLLDGRRVGRGELVEVGGRLGVRITAIVR